MRSCVCVTVCILCFFFPKSWFRFVLFCSVLFADFPLFFITFSFSILPGHPDKLTNPVPNSRDPNFNERFVFPIVTNDQQLRLLLRSRLQVTVVDMHGEEAEDPTDGLIGEHLVGSRELCRMR